MPTGIATGLLYARKIYGSHSFAYQIALIIWFW